MKSTDFGNSWFSIQTFYHSDIKLYIDQNGNIFAGNRDGLKRSTNFGNDWIQIDSGFIGYPSEKLTLLPGQRIYVNTQMGVFKLSSDRVNWLKDSALAGSFVLSGSGNYFLSDGEIHKSTDNGNSWTTVFSALSNNSYTKELIKLSNGHLLSAGVFSGWIHLGSSEILRSTDDGISWNTVYSKGAIDRNSNISLTTITATTNDIILSGGGFNGVIRSTDLGDTWSSSMNGLPEYIDCKVIRVRPDGLIYLGSAFNGVFRSTDKGLSWNEINNGLTSYDIRSIVFNSKGEIFIGTSVGIFKSTNNGDLWIPLNSGLLDISVLSLLCDSLDYLFAATSTTGIFRSVDPTTSVNENIKEIPIANVLNQNYPNPFNPTTIISFLIQKSQYVELKVFDILGNEVAVLLNEYRDAGEHKVKFDGRNLSSGIYFYQLKAGDFIQTKKLIILIFLNL